MATYDDLERAQNEYRNFVQNHPRAFQNLVRAMTDQGTEAFYEIQLQAANNRLQANMDSILLRAKGRALTPEEIVALLNCLHAADQCCSSYAPTAETLSVGGRPNLSQRLAQMQEDMHKAISMYNDMYRSAGQVRSDWQKMHNQVRAEVTQGILESTIYASSIYEKTFRMQTLINEGVPYGEAFLITHPPL